MTMDRRQLFSSAAGAAILGFFGIAAAKAVAETAAPRAEWLVSYVPKHDWERPDTTAKLIPVFDVRPEDEQFDLAARVFEWVRPIAEGGAKPSFVWLRMGDGWVREAGLYDDRKWGQLPPLAEPTVYMTRRAVTQLWNETLVRTFDPEPTLRIFGAKIETLDDGNWSHAAFVRTGSGHTLVEPLHPLDMPRA
jgi:hypothetical protein